MRKTLCVVPALAILFVLALPAWGAALSAPAENPAEVCPVPAGSATLPDLLPEPLFKTGVCGSCSDLVCRGVVLEGPCLTPDGPGICLGFIVSGNPLVCGDGGYQCGCIIFDF